MKFEINFFDSCINSLEESLNQGPIYLIDGQEYRSLNEEQICQVGGLKIHIYANEHPPPHFHIKYNGEENSFSLNDGLPLHPNNGLKHYFTNIKKWHKKNKKMLIKSWNESRPSNCPVGKI